MLSAWLVRNPSISELFLSAHRVCGGWSGTHSRANITVQEAMRVQRLPIYQSQRWHPNMHICRHTHTHTHRLLDQTWVLQFYCRWKSNTDREFGITNRVSGAEIEITNFLLCLTTLNSQLWAMKTSPAEECKSSLHGFVVSCKDAIIQQPQTKSCHPPGGQWSMTKESSWKHLRI